MISVSVKWKTCKLWCDISICEILVWYTHELDMLWDGEFFRQITPWHLTSCTTLTRPSSYHFSTVQFPNYCHLNWSHHWYHEWDYSQNHRYRSPPYPNYHRLKPLTDCSFLSGLLLYVAKRTCVDAPFNERLHCGEKLTHNLLPRPSLAGKAKDSMKTCSRQASRVKNLAS